MKILVTGGAGFMGKNLISELKNRGYNDIVSFDIGNTDGELREMCRGAGYVFHLASLIRPEDPEEFERQKGALTRKLTGFLEQEESVCPVMHSGSSQSELDNPYGRFKKADEDILLEYSEKHGVPVSLFRYTNVFGKWMRPNWNSAVATFCSNIANGLPITVNNPATELDLIYIDDLVDAAISAMEGRLSPDADGFCRVPVFHRKSLGQITDLIYSFRDSRGRLDLPDMSDPFARKLYATYLSYLPKDGFSYPLKQNSDARGSFTEIIRTPDRGQFSVNIAHPGIVKGNHWHHTKNEKFVVVSGEGLIRFRNINCDEVIEYRVSGTKPEVVDIPVGYTHSIANVGDTELITFMWASEPFDPEHPDTYYLNV